MDNVNNKKIAIIGAGHMGTAMIQGLLESGFAEQNLFVSNSSKDNTKAVEQADWVVLTVKPGLVSVVLKELGQRIHNKILISAAAGVTVAKLTAFTENPKQKVIRIMPNIPVATKQGLIGFFVNKAVSREEKHQVIQILNLLGIAIVCREENELDALTLISGCGPALASYCITLLKEAAVSYGFPHETSETIARQTFQGTLSYLQKTNLSASELQTAVSTKGGVTEQIITSLNEKNVPKLFSDSLQKGYTRIKQLREAK